MSFSWLFFRADSVNDALGIFSKIISFKGPIYIGDSDISILPYSIISIFLLSIFDIININSSNNILIGNKNIIIRYMGYIGIVFIILLFGVFDGGQFIYQQF